MKSTRSLCTLACLAATAAIATAAHAEFVVGDLVSVSGTAGPELGGTSWGTQDGQGAHALGGSNVYWDATFGNPVFLTVGVSSLVNNGGSVTFTIDFSAFQSSDFTLCTVDILGLKQDGTLDLVTASQGMSSTDGNNVHWMGSGADLSEDSTLLITVRQGPAPGALALLGAAGLAGARRRRR